MPYAIYFSLQYGIFNVSCYIINIFVTNISKSMYLT